MSYTLFADVSEFQPTVNDRYQYRFVSIRSNDGTYRDSHFANNLAWAKHACSKGHLEGFLVYLVFEENWRETFQTFKAMVGAPHPKMAVMIDVENWGGKIAGDHSKEINALRGEIRKWLRAHTTKTDYLRGRKPYKRVLGYGNVGDLNTLWRKRGSTPIVLASYGANPRFKNKVAHQFADNFDVAPFGKCDINSADGYTPVQFARKLGLVLDKPKPKKADKPAPPKHRAPAKPKPAKPAKAKKPKKPKVVHTVKSGDTMSSIAKSWHVSLKALEKANPHAGHPAGHFGDIRPGDKITHP